MFNASNDCGISADFIRLLKDAADGRFEPEKLPAGLNDSGVAEILAKIADARTAVKKNPLPMVITDPRLNIIDPNDAALEIFGWSREEALRLNIKDIDVLDLKGESIVVAVHEKRSISNEMTIRCPKGTLVLKSWGIPLLDPAGNVRGVQMEFVDVTAEKNAAADTAAWYESILDAVPFPITVTDLDMNWTFVNRAVENFLGRTRAEIMGHQCSEWQANICKTPNCGIACLRRGQHQTFFEQNGGNFQVDVSYIKNARGENVGHVEVVQDISVMVKASRYMEGEVQRLAGNLSRLAAGNLVFDTNIAPADRYTEEVRRNFVKIMESLAKVRENVGAMLEDAGLLARAAQDGRLQVRADATRHEGEFRAIIEDLNATLDAVVTPLTEANHVLQRMAVNDHTTRMTGQYQGTYGEVATAINLVEDRFNRVADVFERISHGDFSDREALAKLGRRSEQDRLTPAGLRTLEALQALATDTEMLNRAARNGQLGVRADAAKHEGEYRKIVEGINETLDTVVVPFRMVKEAIVQLESSTQETSRSSDEIAKAAEQVAVTSQKCADLAKQVLNQIEGVESQMADLSASNEEIAGTVQEVLSVSNETARIGRDGLELGESAKQKMAVVEDISRQSMEEIVKLNGQMAEIGKIVKLINDIANQTNLLALNAAIEAARAGEHGRGFAVVAGEIRNLAGESKKASHNIEDLIASIVANSNRTATNMEQVYAEIEEGVESVNRTIAELKKIVSGAETVSGDVGEIARAIESQANVANRVVEAMGEGTRLTKATQAQVENLASLSEETSASTEEIGSAAHELNTMAGDLKATMQRFSF
ncbi:MAG: methyl-accepting chemotaxis protein [Euryarchaeota archaeon]|nr:methyl-accepting chemotaxis protein [Euryarchaeota archaeon]